MRHLCLRTATALLSGLVMLTVLSSSFEAGAAEEKKPKPPPARITQTLSQKVFKQIEEAQKAFDAKDYQQALAIMRDMKGGYDRFNDYEKATYWSFLAAVHYSVGDEKSAIEDYRNVLAQNNLPEATRNSALFALAQLYFVVEDYAATVKTLQQWFKIVPEPSPDAYMLLAQVYYQQQKYKDSEKTILDALRIVKARQTAPKESWLALLRAVYYELHNYERSAKVLEVLVSSYPKETYFLQLSGIYGLLGNQRQQLIVLHAAYVGGMVLKPEDRLNLARLYMAQGAPYRAVELIKKGFKDKTLETTTDNLQLYAQALALAKEYEQQIPVLKQLADRSGESRHYLYLGQAYNQIGDWDKAANAFRGALGGKGLKDRAAVQIQLGIALFNGGKLAQAREVFQRAADTPKVAEAATNWVKFVSSEIRRKEALEGG